MNGWVVDASVAVKTADKPFLDRVQNHPYLADSIRHIGDIGPN